MEGLSTRPAARVWVTRDGAEREVLATEIVVGDLVRSLDEGTLRSAS